MKTIFRIAVMLATVFLMAVNLVQGAYAGNDRVKIHHESQGAGDPSWTKCMPESAWNGHEGHNGDWKGGKCDEEPTVAPTEKPTQKPTVQPTIQPTEKPTEKPTAKPTIQPTEKPTEKPTAKPTFVPTYQPTTGPTQIPPTATQEVKYYLSLQEVINDCNEWGVASEYEPGGAKLEFKPGFSGKWGDAVRQDVTVEAIWPNGVVMMAKIAITKPADCVQPQTFLGPNAQSNTCSDCCQELQNQISALGYKQDQNFQELKNLTDRRIYDLQDEVKNLANAVNRLQMDNYYRPASGLDKLLAAMAEHFVYIIAMGFLLSILWMVLTAINDREKAGLVARVRELTAEKGVRGGTPNNAQ